MQLSTPPASPPSESTSIPRHAAIIMDGNGRWAQQRGRPRLFGHQAGTENIRRIIETCAEVGVEVLTLYAFSTENWRRPVDEVSGLMVILGEVIDRETPKLHANGVKLRHIGSLEGVPSKLRQRVEHAVGLTRNNPGLIVNVAFNYGGRAEIVDAVRRMIAEGMQANEVTEESLTAHLHTSGLPDPDLIIRTAGEFRVSNFLIWQGAYAEFYSSKLFWPDFDREELLRAFEEFGRRSRRFGSI
ncbi:MAG: isoprenyl transferase [Chloroflexi bacterium]|nr:isoprenyl transferase [Chloroflexota bacterium]